MSDLMLTFVICFITSAIGGALVSFYMRGRIRKPPGSPPDTPITIGF